jgi:hypothetical protein
LRFPGETEIPLDPEMEFELAIIKPAPATDGKVNGLRDFRIPSVP